MGAAFGGIVKSLVSDILTPLIGAVVKVPDFSDFAFTIRGSKFMFGSFLNNLIAFLLVSIAVYFFVVLPMNHLLQKMKKGELPKDPTTKKCPLCWSEIAKEAKRCAFCTSQIS